MPGIDQCDGAAFEIPDVARRQCCSVRMDDARDHRVGLTDRPPQKAALRRDFGMGIGGRLVVGQHATGHVYGKNGLHCIQQLFASTTGGERCTNGSPTTA